MRRRESTGKCKVEEEEGKRERGGASGEGDVYKKEEEGIQGVTEYCGVYFFFQAEDGIRDLVRSRGLGDVYKKQFQCLFTGCRKIVSSCFTL